MRKRPLAEERSGPEGKPVHFIEAAEATVLPNGMVIGRDGSFLYESADLRSRNWFANSLATCRLENLDRMKLRRSELRRIAKWPTRRIDGRGVLAINGVASNYFHWITSICVGLEYTRQFMGLGDLTLITPRTNPWQRELLDLAGFTSSARAVHPTASEFVTSDLLIFPPYLSRHDFSFPPQLFALAARIKAAVQQHAEAALAGLTAEQADLYHRVRVARRLYISRRHASLRALPEEQLIEQHVESHGFVPVALERLPLRVQLLLLAEARYLIGLHGAGLTNVIFAPPGSRVVEIVPPSIKPGNETLFSHLAAAAGLHHRTILLAGSNAATAAPTRLPLPAVLAELSGLLGGNLPPAPPAPASPAAASALSGPRDASHSI